MVNDFNGVILIDAQPQSRVQQWKKLPKCTITGEHGGKPLYKYRLAEDVKKKSKHLETTRRSSRGYHHERTPSYPRDPRDLSICHREQTETFLLGDFNCIVIGGNQGHDSTNRFS